MNISKGVMVPSFEVFFEKFQFLGENIHWATCDMCVPALSNNVDAIRVFSPNF